MNVWKLKVINICNCSFFLQCVKSYLLYFILDKNQFRFISFISYVYQLFSDPMAFDARWKTALIKSMLKYTICNYRSNILFFTIQILFQ